MRTIPCRFLSSALILKITDLKSISLCEISEITTYTMIFSFVGCRYDRPWLTNSQDVNLEHKPLKGNLINILH